MNKKQLQYLSGIIKENQFYGENHHELKNYMFFSNLKTILDRVNVLLSMNPHMLDAMLDDGHDWANDHVATSKDDIEEVYNWATTRANDNTC